MSGFKSYKIRDGVHIPSEKYKENWDAIFGKKKKSKITAKKKKPKKNLDNDRKHLGCPAYPFCDLSPLGCGVLHNKPEPIGCRD